MSNAPSNTMARSQIVLWDIYEKDTGNCVAGVHADGPQKAILRYYRSLGFRVGRTLGPEPQCPHLAIKHQD